MRLSNKSTFSLACLILLMAFVALPVMAHVITGDTAVHLATNHPAHAVLSKVELLGDAADGYVGTDSFNIRITFSGTGGTPTNFTADNINISGTADGGMWQIRDVAGSGLVYTARILPPSDAETDDLDVIITLQGTVIVATPDDDGAGEDIFLPLNADGDDDDKDPDIGIEADKANPAKAVVYQDVTAPKLPAAPSYMAVQGKPFPLNYLTNGVVDEFEIRFTITGAGADKSADYLDSETIKITAAPDHFEFGAVGRLGADQFTVIATPKDKTIADAADVIITITATDKAGNPGTAMLTVKLAERTKSGPTMGLGDKEKPALSEILSPATLEEDGTVIFTITFSEPVVSFTVGHLVVTNGGTPTAADFTTTDNKVFKLKVTPNNADFPVKVEVAPNTQVSDAAGNESAALTGSDTYTPAGVLGVEIDQPATTSPDGTLRFKFTFGAKTALEGAGAFTISDITASNAEALTDADLQQSVSDTMVYWLTVTPMDPTNPVTVQLNADAVSDNVTGEAQKVAGQVSATFTPADTDPVAASDDGVIIVPANGFVVVVRDPDVSKPGAGGLDFPSGVGTDRWVDMPDLQELFDENAPGGGGALILRRTSDQAALSSGTVGISEVMWGIDLGHLGNETRQIASQWIELHNLNSTDVKVQLSAKTGRAITSDTAIIGNLSDPVIDVMTNFFNNRPGAKVWNVPGTSGNSVSGGDFKAMARILPSDNKAFDLGRKKDGQYIGRYTNTGGANKSRDGRASSSWTAATSAYDTLRTTRTDVTNTLYNFVGTPGKVNTFKPTAQPHIKDARRNVPANPIIFNEIANLSNPDHEWIELRNVTSGKVNLRNYLISVVTSDSSDAVLYQFPNNNSAQVDANGVFLLVTSDPRDKPDHPLAVGWNVDIKKEDQIVGLGDNPPEYKVTPFAGDGLPDDGKFVLILRKPDNHEGHRSGAHGSKGVAETKTGDLDKVVDIAGWSDNVSKSAYSNPVSSTGIWPLRAMGGIGGFTNNKLEVNKVHYRRNVGTNDGRAGAGGVENKNDKSAFTDVGHNGVGYKRQAARSNANGGSPGYHNNLKGKLGDLADNAKVVISEIMLTQGGGRSVLPQWIELHNTSKTQAVNLADDQGWRLVIETPGDPIRTINFKDKGSVKTILPNQTVLIVSAAARSFGSTHLPALTTFPATRVFDVYRELRTHFEMENRTSPFLNPKAFHISLWDGKSKDGDYIGEMSDVIGNLDGNARTNDKAAWEFPESITEGGYRSSLIRIFDEGKPRNGVSMDADIVKPLGGAGGVGVDGLPGVDPKYSWVHAADTGFNSNRFVRHTWYGDENDRATPIDRAGQVLPVSLSYFRPTLENGEIVIRWTTESELDNAGFNILRSDSQSGEFKQVNSELVQGAGTTGERNTYKWVDETAKLGVVYYYQIEDVSFAGEHQTLMTTKLKGLISAKNKLTTLWGGLKEVQ